MVTYIMHPIHPKRIFHMHIDYVGTMFPLQALCYMKIGTKTHSPLHQPLKEKPTYKIPQQLATFNVTTLPSTT